MSPEAISAHEDPGGEVEVIQTAQSAASLILSADELVTLDNALNDVLHGIHVDEFQTRIGISRDAARLLLREVGDVLPLVGG